MRALRCQSAASTPLVSSGCGRGRVAFAAQMALHKTLLFSALLALAWAQDEEPLTDEEKMKKKHDEVASYPYCMEDNCYELLGVKKDAGGLPIKRAYRKLASEWHPDKNPDPRAKTLFQKYANAYEVLSSPQVSGAACPLSHPSSNTNPNP